MVNENPTKALEEKKLSPLKISSLVSIIFIMSVTTLLLSFLFARFALNLKPFRVLGNAMSPTISHHDLVFTNRDVYPIQRGDIIIFHHPHKPAYSYIMRVIALPSETISIDEAGQLFINDVLQDEPYLATENSTLNEKVPKQTLKANHYWVMGDNRNNSNDSRDWGPVPETLIVSKVIWRYWPPAKFGAIE